MSVIKCSLCQNEISEIYGIDEYNYEESKCPYCLSENCLELDENENLDIDSMLEDDETENTNTSSISLNELDNYL